MYGYRVEKYKGIALGNCLFYSLELFCFLFTKYSLELLMNYRVNA